MRSDKHVKSREIQNEETFIRHYLEEDMQYTGRNIYTNRYIKKYSMDEKEVLQELKGRSGKAGTKQGKRKQNRDKRHDTDGYNV